MKAKKIVKRLDLNKLTIADLEKDELNRVRGGLSLPVCKPTIDLPCEQTFTHCMTVCPHGPYC